jgi:peptidoglycan/LPS O-acetylase OafA/YrhL
MRIAAPRLWTIDALRGAAALGVVLSHANLADRAGPGVSGAIVHGALEFGRYGVWLFFVISGFCIHYRWALAARAGVTAPPDFLAFWRRRFRRLYPPYLVALALFVGLRFGSSWTNPETLGVIGAHLLMLHNLDRSTVAGINQVFWTLAIEEQLYLLYFVLIRIRAASGWLLALGVGVGVRLLWFVVAGLLHRFAQWDVLVTQSVFAQWPVWMLGALSVEAMIGLVEVPRVFARMTTCVVLLAAAAWMSYSLLYVLAPGTVYRCIWLAADLVWGLAFFVMVNLAVARQRDPRQPSPLASMLARIGLFSYSLYLTHEVVTGYGWPLLSGLLPGAPVVVVIAAAVLASLGVAKVFFVLFERPFLSAGSRAATPAVAI